MAINQGERLARIETLLENISDNIVKLEKKIEKLDTDQLADKADLAALKNKGAGLLIGVGLLGGGAGAFISKLWAAW